MAGDVQIIGTGVQQQPLDASELCKKLDDVKVPLKHDGSSDVYERNVAKTQYCP